MLNFNGFIFEPGQSITCKIEEHQIHGRIHFEKDRNILWICHDKSKFDGDESPAMYGYPYSWGFHIINDRFLSDGVSDLIPSSEDISFKDTKIDSKLKDIFSSIIEYTSFMKAFYYKLSPFEDFSKISESKDTGFIKLSGSVKTKNGVFKKNIDIKLSRYLKKVSDSFSSEMKKKGQETTGLFTDSQIEKIYNSFVAFQSDEYFRLEILKGTNIEQGYLSKNYSNVTNGTLHKSCMTDKGHYLGIYMNNDNISLAVLKSNNGVEARCLLWTLEDGTIVYDRIYYTFDWVEDVMIEKLRKSSFTSLEKYSRDTPVSIKIENSDFEFYPYIDNFLTHSVERNTLYTIIPKITGNYRRYSKTDGGYHTLTI